MKTRKMISSEDMQFPVKVRAIASAFLLIMVQSIVLPTVSWAVSGGPSQPEAGSFTPANHSEMVNLATGDFSYNLPLLNVPGPNGGYPINLGYHAGIGMEQEASWVGLGWDLNPGAITRNVRGLPDDFKGDQVKKSSYMRPTWTFGAHLEKYMSLPGNPIPFGDELLGFGLNPTEFTLYYNNVRGLGFTASTSMNLLLKSKLSSADGKEYKGVGGGLTLGFSYDSQAGLGMTPSLSAGQIVQGCEGLDYGTKWKAGVSVGLHSRQGFTGVDVSGHYGLSWWSRKSKGGKTSGGYSVNFPSGAGMSFSGGTYVPGQSNIMTGTDVSVELSLDNTGTDNWISGIPFWFDGKSIMGYLNTNKIAENNRDLSAYGYLYSSDADVASDEDGRQDQIFDYNREKDVAVTKNNKTMPIPVATNDIYSVSGQGIGGMFRAYRNDVGVYHKDGITSHNHRANVGFEVGFSPTAEYKLGFDAGYGSTKSYSGGWTGEEGVMSKVGFQETDLNDPDFEPYYFRMSGDLVASPYNQLDHIGGESPLKVGLRFRDAAQQDKPHHKRNDIGASEHFTNSAQVNTSVSIRNANRAKRSTNIESFTRDMITSSPRYLSGQRDVKLFTGGQLPGVDAGANYQYTNGQGHHVQAIRVRQTSGAVYAYDLPVYNTEQHESYFSVEIDDADEYNDMATTPYASDDRSGSNDKGRDHLYMNTELPPYAQSYMLTSVVSDDYVDLTGDGPSEDDLGGWTKFNYQDGGEYMWRTPYEGANYSKGFYSDRRDDRGSVRWGKRESYYVHSIETKTHVAIFEMGDRADGRGASSEDQSATSAQGNSQKYLRSIKLYSKLDPAYAQGTAQPIKEVHFTYDYSLCPGVPNNDQTVDSPWVTSNTGGKLTLKKVHFVNNGNSKGEARPYEFEYNTTNDPGYNPNLIDRWGSYQQPAPLTSMQSAPYTRQDMTQEDMDEWAAMWSLKKINLPTGGTIEVKYEADDYAYVQDRRAMQMMEFVGVSETDDLSIDDNLAAPVGSFARRSAVTFRKNSTRLWFKTEAPVTTSDDVLEYIDGIDQLYFKVWTRLKAKYASSEIAYDYVDGYAEIDKDHSDWYGVDADNSSYAYVDVKSVGYKKNGNGHGAHPIAKAGWQYLRYERSDLENQNYDNSSQAAGQIIGLFVGIIGVIPEIPKMISYYGYRNSVGHAKMMGNSKKSFLRLNSPDNRKYGGGLRVRSVKVSDSWAEGGRSHGTQYSYSLPDGSSSGVADYEPMVGGEENAMRQPIWYNGTDELFRNQDAYIETPLGESFYPAANVIYSRVTTSPLDVSDGGIVSDSDGSSVVHEFYTAKDFPVKVKRTGLDWKKGANYSFTVPFVGSITNRSNAYSMGYSIELNDMSGKPKSVGTYANGTENTPGVEPVHQVKYLYNTHQDGSLNSKVRVMDAHGEDRMADMGVTYDMYVEHEQNSTKSIAGDVGVNLDVFLLAIVPSVSYNVNSLKAVYRGAVTTKVIQRMGVLNEVQTFSEGSWSKVKNLKYDAETGQPLLTVAYNEWDKPIYSYNYAAHWAYPGMRGAYENHGISFLVNQVGLQAYMIDEQNNILDSHELLQKGDVLRYYHSGQGWKEVYVNKLDLDGSNDSYFEAIEEDGSALSSQELDGLVLQVVKSGNRNLQSVSNGGIQAFYDPSGIEAANMVDAFFGLYSNYIAGNLHDYEASTADNTILFLYADLCTYSYGADYQGISIRDQGSEIVVQWWDQTYPDGCHLQFTFDNGRPSQTINSSDWESTVRFDNIIQDAGQITLDFLHKEGNDWVRYPMSLSRKDACWDQVCPGEGVLNASAIEYKDDWGGSYPYEDLGSPEVAGGNLLSAQTNEYRYGKKGVWKPLKSFAYRADRKQSGTEGVDTRIDKDGEFEHFVPFDWSQALNPNWEWTSEATLFSPYGFGIESKARASYIAGSTDEKEVHNAQLMGYGNSLVIAGAANATYYELGFDGFEEQGLTYEQKGHIPFMTAPEINTTYAHTGSQSVDLTTDPSGLSFEMHPLSSSSVLRGEEGKEYVVSMWVRTEDFTSGIASLEVTDGGVSIGSSQVGAPTNMSGGTMQQIDGWTKLETEFTMPSSGVTIRVTSTEYTQIDDVRVGPKQGGMVTHVYDTKNLWPIAVLDGLNYATFYDYDSEGNLVQVRKETEEGVVTQSTTRINVKEQ